MTRPTSMTRDVATAEALLPCGLRIRADRFGVTTTSADASVMLAGMHRDTSPTGPLTARSTARLPIVSTVSIAFTAGATAS